MIRQAMRQSLVSGTSAGLASTIALAAVAVAERAAPAQPLNATSHWLNGDGAARRRRFDIAHTGVGFATHLSATIFWAAFFEAWSVARPTYRPQVVVRRAATIAAAAAIVDFTITPKRFTPGWELVLSKSSMSLAYAALAAGLAGTALARPVGR